MQAELGVQRLPDKVLICALKVAVQPGQGLCCLLLACRRTVRRPSNTQHQQLAPSAHECQCPIQPADTTSRACWHVQSTGCMRVWMQGGLLRPPAPPG